MNNATATKSQTVGNLIRQSLEKLENFEGKMGGGFSGIRAGVAARSTKEEQDEQLEINLDNAVGLLQNRSDDKALWRTLEKGVQYQADDMLILLRSLFPNTSLSTQDIRVFYVKALQCVLWHKGKGFFPIDPS